MESNNHYYNIEAYLEGSLNPKAMHEFEKQALEDPFLGEALEGYIHTSGGATRHLSILQRQLQERISADEVKKNDFFFSWQRLSIAAAAGLMLILATVLFWMKTDRTKPEKQRTMELAIGGADSIAAKNIANTTDLSTQPQGGWAKYEEYLQKNARVSSEQVPGSVVVEFKVTEEGTLEAFKIIQSLDDRSDRQAIRLIKEGPKWQTIQPARKLQVKVSFK